MSKIGPLLIIIFLLSGCGYFVSKDELAEQVKQSLNENIAKDADYSGLTIDEIALVRESAHKFTGYVTYRFKDNTERVNLTVTVDGSQMIYTCEPPRSLIAEKRLGILLGVNGSPSDSETQQTMSSQESTSSNNSAVNFNSATTTTNSNSSEVPLFPVQASATENTK